MRNQQATTERGLEEAKSTVTLSEERLRNLFVSIIRDTAAQAGREFMRTSHAPLTYTERETVVIQSAGEEVEKRLGWYLNEAAGRPHPVLTDEEADRRAQVFWAESPMSSGCPWEHVHPEVKVGLRLRVRELAAQQGALLGREAHQ